MVDSWEAGWNFGENFNRTSMFTTVHSRAAFTPQNVHWTFLGAALPLLSLKDGAKVRRTFGGLQIFLQKKGKKSAFLFFLAVFINVDSDFLEWIGLLGEEENTFGKIAESQNCTRKCVQVNNQVIIYIIY